MPPQFENNNVPPTNLENHHRDPSILIILIIVMLLSGAGAIWYMLNLPPEPTPQPITKVDQFADTNNWKTYRNEELGFEFKYPDEDWIVESDSKGSITIIKKEDLEYSYSGLNLTIVKEDPEFFFKKYALKITNKMRVEKIEWIWASAPNPNLNSEVRYFNFIYTRSDDNKLYIFSYITPRTEYEKILSTFKFTK